MPFETFDDDDLPSASSDEFKKMYTTDTGFKAKLERISGEARNATAHATKWFEGTKHLHDPETQAAGQKLIEGAQRGLYTGYELNDFMSHRFGAIYPRFDPTDTPFSVPDHLGEQFR